MPVERRSRRKQLTAVGIGVLSLVVAIGIAWGLLELAGGDNPSNQLRLGDDVFEAGNAVRLSTQIDKDGPLLLSDVSGRGQTRPIFVNHFGDDPEIRWVAFDAAAPGADENCFLSWNGEREVYEERSVVDGVEHEEGELCRDLTFPPNGEGLDQYPWRVDEEGLLIIDLRPDDDVSVNGTGTAGG
jgi:hypothetical protein